jgi:hypothetical protein
MTHPQLAMPLFSDPTPIGRDAVLAAWKSLFPNGPRLLAVETEQDGVEDYRVEGKRSVLVVQIAKPVPTDEALAAVRSSWMWQESDEVVRSHRAHAIVTAAEADTPVGAAWDVARVCAALLAAGNGAALYWGNSRQVHPVKAAIELASKLSSPPVPLWVGITISGASKKGPFSAATHGLESLGHKEFEVRDTTMAIGNLRMTLLELAAYVIANGPVLEHGQTFGPNEKVRWTICHEPSQLVEGRDAIVLGLD